MGRTAGAMRKMLVNLNEQLRVSISEQNMTENKEVISAMNLMHL